MTSLPPTLTNVRVLLVDDDPALLRGLGIAFSRAGSQVVTACDGNEALQRMAERLPDLLVTDILMPNREGLETIMAARAEAPALKIIAISGGGRIDSGEFLSLALALGADAILRKPFRPSRMLSLAEGVLAQRAAA